MNVSLKHSARQSPDSAWRIIDGQAVIISGDGQRVRVLNDVGSRIWELSDGRTLEQMVAQLLSEFDVDQSALCADVLSFVDDLVRRDMIQLGEPDH